MSSPRRVGIYGGTFDPPHAAHLAVARAAADALELDRLELIVSARPPHRSQPGTPASERLDMVTLATKGDARLVASPREILRSGKSFTVETLRELRAELPEAELFLLIGGDSYDELPSWKDHRTILELAHLAVVARPGSAGPEAWRPEDFGRVLPVGTAPPAGQRAVYHIAMEPSPIAARTLRAQLAAGEDPGDAIDPSVLEYIRKRGLYAAPAAQRGPGEPHS